jgi:hypothetical protein
MSEFLDHSESREKILPNQTLLLAEPIFKSPDKDESKKSTFEVPLGTEALISQIPFDTLTDEKLIGSFVSEYMTIVDGLRKMNAPFRIIVSHGDDADLKINRLIRESYGIRGLTLSPLILETCFPRDMMVDFNGKVFVNPKANFQFPDNSGIISPLGEGGRILMVGEKVFASDPRGFTKTKSKYMADLRSVPMRYKLGFLPHPQGVEVDRQSKIIEIFPNDHLDRVAAFIKGEDSKDYLLLDKNYVDERQAPYGEHWPNIKNACQKLDVIPVVVDRNSNSIPYALNLEQFEDGTVLFTGGDKELAEIIKRIVGVNNVYTTEKPIFFYPIFRKGGIRCMLLHAPQRIVGQPIAMRI